MSFGTGEPMLTTFRRSLLVTRKAAKLRYSLDAVMLGTGKYLRSASVVDGFSCKLLVSEYCPMLFSMPWCLKRTPPRRYVDLNLQLALERAVKRDGCQLARFFRRNLHLPVQRNILELLARIRTSLQLFQCYTRQLPLDST
eukprot:974108-Pleurochrysis_carterae.AAC.7